MKTFPQENFFFKFSFNLEFFYFAKTFEKHTWFIIIELPVKRNLLTPRGLLVERAPLCFLLKNSLCKDRERKGFIKNYPLFN
tara:strand:+ start:165 stop:410 length:246 start_codon:yes stop_codon:yes gene_type:complete